MAHYNRIFHIFLFLCLFIHIKSQYTRIKAKSIESICDTNLFRFVINIHNTEQLNDYKSFYLNAIHEEGLLFKCIIDPTKSQIICITNLEQQKVYLNAGDKITLPYPFPHVEGIIWDYPSFVTYIYRRVIRISEGCGKTVIKSDLSKVNPTKWDLITKINKLYDGQCLLSDMAENYYSFKLNLNILGGNLFGNDTSQTTIGVSFLQNITMPFILGKLQLLGKNSDNYYSHEYYKTAFCYPTEDIKNTNYDKEEGFDFNCNIPLSEKYLFNGPLKIYSFSDNIYAKVVNNNKETNIDYISIYFSTEKNPNLNENPEEVVEESEEKIGNKDDNDDDNFGNEDNNNKTEEEEEKIGDNDKDNNNKTEEEEEKIGDNDKDIVEETPQGSSSSSNSNKASSSPSSSSPFKSSASSSSPSSSSSSSSKSSASSSGSNASPSASSSNLRGLDEPIIKKTKEFLILDDKKFNYLCPDMPIFEIPDIKEGIKYEPVPEENDKFNVILKGYLKNGFKLVNGKMIPLEFTTDSIDFNISIINNLAEKISEKKNNIVCSINSGTMFLKEDLTQIKCQGQKIEQTEKQNTDLSINWASKENKYLKNILIKWPKDLNDITIHSKKIYSYEIYALSIRKTDYDCFDDRFYFYVDILDINSEPQINFNISLLNPDRMPAQCKLYSSNMLKCFLDLKFRKIKKGTNIRLPLPGNYNISTNEGNYINFTVFNFIDENETEIADDGIITDQTCGNNVLVGAVQNIGYNYASALIIIICFFITIGILFFCVVSCITYEITHRDKKGIYFPHVEEKHKDVNTTANTTTTNPNTVAQNKTIGIVSPVKA